MENKAEEIANDFRYKNGEPDVEISSKTGKCFYSSDEVNRLLLLFASQQKPEIALQKKHIIINSSEGIAQPISLPKSNANISELVDEFMYGFEDPFTRGEMLKSETSSHSINIAYYFELAMEYALLHYQARIQPSDLQKEVDRLKELLKTAIPYVLQGNVKDEINEALNK